MCLLPVSRALRLSLSVPSVRASACESACVPSLDATGGAQAVAIIYYSDLSSLVYFGRLLAGAGKPEIYPLAPLVVNFGGPAHDSLGFLCRAG